MTIIEKLAEITEKVSRIDIQKVYDVGYSNGLKDAVPKTFSVDYGYGSSDTYNFMVGMTWRDWLDSGYNTNGWYIADWGAVYTGALSVQYNGFDVSPDDLIIENAVYTTG